MNEATKVRACRQPWHDEVEVRLFREDGNRIFAVTNLTYSEIKRGDYSQPSFCLSPQEAQALFNQLWQDGYRPKDGTGNTGHIEAISYHLEDMRKLVFEETKLKQGAACSEAEARGDE